MMSDQAHVLFLDVSLKHDRLMISLSEQNSPFYQSEEIVYPCDQIQQLCRNLSALLNQAFGSPAGSFGRMQEFQKTGQLLYDLLLSSHVKTRLRQADRQHLIIQVDEALVFIPWEWLYDGRDFLCLKFCVGRRVMTTRRVETVASRTLGRPCTMLILADPSGDLPAARQEALRIRDRMDSDRRRVAVSIKLREISLDYVRRYLRDYDCVHFAGHTEYVEGNSSLSGWRLADGIFSVQDIAHMRGGAPFPFLLFLNSCQSARTALPPVMEDYEEHCFGILHAFLESGVKQAVGTLWRIPDAPAQAFAVEFYDLIGRGVSIGEALRSARLKMIREFGWESMIWAAYVLYGDPNVALFSDGGLGKKKGMHPRVLRKWRPENLRRFAMGCLVLGLFAAGIFSYQHRTVRPSRLSFSGLTIAAADRQGAEDAVLPPSDESFRETRDRHQRIIRERLFAFPPAKSSRQEKEIGEILKGYQKAEQAAQVSGNRRFAAEALMGQAEIYRMMERDAAALNAYAGAMEQLSRLESLNAADRYQLAQVYAQLAGLYAVSRQDFVTAEQLLNRIGPCLSGITEPSEDSARLVLRNVEYAVSKISQGPYLNSHLAHRAREVLEEVREPARSGAQ